MVFFWKKKKEAEPTREEVEARGVVDAAIANSQESAEEWRSFEAQQRKEEKRREKAMAKEAKKAMREMKKQARKARKERRKAEKLVKKQNRAMVKIQKKQQRAERKRIAAIAKERRDEEKRRKRLIRKRKKEEKRRRKQARVQEDLHHQRAQDEIETQELQAITAAQAIATGELSVAPAFKEDKRCKTCYTKFQRILTRRRHHCRNCGESFCGRCLSKTKRAIPWFKLDKPQIVCFTCDVQVFRNNGSESTPAPVRPATPQEATPEPRPPTPVETNSPLRSQRSVSFQSEQPEDDTPASPASRKFSLRLRPRSRRDSNSPKRKKSSLWTLPIRPLLKRKASADQLRNRTWDLDLRLEKEEMLARQRKSQMVVVTPAPRFAQAS